ncbi:MAG: hypothetical protein IPH50_14880 [Rhodanobacteraceae bacterium]|nr:hypothetical protein [Rhodanobacteraceae bacterium]
MAAGLEWRPQPRYDFGISKKQIHRRRRKPHGGEPRLRAQPINDYLGMTMKKILLAMLLGASAVSAQELAIDPPLTKDEKRALKDMREQWAEADMPAMTTEQEIAMIKNMRDTQIRMMGQAMGMRRALESGAMQGQLAQSPVQAQDSPLSQPTAEPTVAKEDLATAYEQRSASTRFTRFERKGDGFLANGQVFIDIDGKVKQFGADPMTGRVTYFVDVGNGDLLVKHHNINSDLEPILIGRIALRGDRADFRAVSGETAGGESVVPVSDGLIVTRKESIARYSIGKGAKAFAVPDGFNVAPLQNGDVSGTGYVLIERIPQEEVSFKEIGKSVGHLFGKRDDTQDYALLHIETGKTGGLFLSDEGKSVGQGTGCVRQNDFVNKCSGWRSWGFDLGNRRSAELLPLLLGTDVGSDQVRPARHRQGRRHARGQCDRAGLQGEVQRLQAQARHSLVRGRAQGRWWPQHGSPTRIQAPHDRGRWTSARWFAGLGQ